jgi:hypothetical protein
MIAAIAITSQNVTVRDNAKFAKTILVVDSQTICESVIK